MSLPKIKFKVVTPERTVFRDEIDQVTLPATDGEVTILPNHTPYITVLGFGEIVLKKNGKETSLAVSGGFVEFNKNELVILADMAEREEEIDLARAEDAKKLAEETMKKKITLDESEYALVAAAVERESARIKVAKKHHSKNTPSINSL